MKLRPLHDWVVIERDSIPFEESGFFIPSPPPNQGAVLAIGPLVQQLCVGDRVRFNPYSGWSIFVHQDEISLIRQTDVWDLFCIGRGNCDQ